MDKLLIEFVVNNKLAIFLAILFLLPIIPHSWAKLDSKYIDTITNQPKDRMKLNLFGYILLLIYSIIEPVVPRIMAFFSFEAFLTFLIFVIVAANLLTSGQLSQGAVILVALGLIIKYFQQILDKAKTIKIWKFFEWESK